MKNLKFKKPLLLILPALFLLFSGLSAFSSQDGVKKLFKKAVKKYDSKGIEGTIPVPKNAVRALVTYNGNPFYTQTRKNEIERFKCSSCHNNKEVKINDAAKISHADIKVVHGGKDKPLDCYACHNKDNRNFLSTTKEKKIDIDHVYNMCGECHFRQKKDWIGGAHGKRVTYWAGERVVQNCTSCHDPHSPKFEKRWPKTYSPPFK